MQGPLPRGMCHGSRARPAGTQGSRSDTAMETHQLLGLQKGRDSVVDGSWLTWGICYLLKFTESGIGETVEQREITTR